IRSTRSSTSASSSRRPARDVAARAGCRSSPAPVPVSSAPLPAPLSIMSPRPLGAASAAHDDSSRRIGDFRPCPPRRRCRETGPLGSRAGEFFMGATGALSLSEHWSSAADPDLAVTTRGDVAPADVTRAVRAIGRVLRRHHLNVPARVRITAPTGPDKDRPNVVQANVRLPHTSARVQVTGPRGFAVTFAVERLARPLTRLAARRGGGWRDPARPPLAEVTPPRPVVRRKRCTLLIGTPAEAIAVMDAMDYDAHLFTDSDTGEDAMVGWTEPSGATLIRQRTTVDVRGRAHEPT